VEETGLLSGVAPAEVLIKGLLVVAVAWVADVPVLLVEPLLLLLVLAELVFVFVLVLVLVAVLVCDDCEADSAFTGDPALSRAE
jgi:hypothetical protein